MIYSAKKLMLAEFQMIIWDNCVCEDFYFHKNQTLFFIAIQNMILYLKRSLKITCNIFLYHAIYVTYFDDKYFIHNKKLSNLHSKMSQRKKSVKYKTVRNAPNGIKYFCAVAYILTGLLYILLRILAFVHHHRITSRLWQPI